MDLLSRIAGWLGQNEATISAKRYEEAVAFARKSLQLAPDDAGTHRLLAASLAQLDRISEAQASSEQASRLQPGFQVAQYAALAAGLGADPEVVERFEDGLRRAG